MNQITTIISRVPANQIIDTLQVNVSLYGALMTNPDHVQSIVNRLGNCHNARKLAAMETIVAYYWIGKSALPVECFVTSDIDSRNVWIELPDGRRIRARQYQIWDKPAHPKTGLPYGQKWLTKAISRTVHNTMNATD